MHRRRNGLDQGRRIGIALERPHADDAAILHLGEKGAPMGMITDELGHAAAPESDWAASLAQGKKKNGRPGALPKPPTENAGADL